MSTVLEFLNNEANENEGLGDAGIETFKDAPYASAAKEAGQNSRDAAVSNKPVRLKFILHEIPRAGLPGHTQLNDAIDSCLRRVVKRPDEKEEDFFRKAKSVLDKPTIKILEIADYNTTGLIGPAEEGKPFYALLKSVGVSNKENETSSGSFGIGKNASFAISDLQTVYYSTIYKDSATGKEQFLAQGKTKLVSHVNHQGQAKKATGWWGLPGFKEIEDPALVTNWMKRSETGTSVYALGFREEADWKLRVVAALLRTFFIAIRKGDMEFQIDGSFDINQTSIHKYFYDSSVLNAAEASHAKDEFEFARYLYECFIATEASEHTIHVPSQGQTQLGDVSIRILKQPGLPKRVGFVRNGMMITDNLKHFGHPFRVFPMSADFIALVQPMDDLGSALLKKLENPPHDQFSADRLSNDRKRDEATKIMKKLGQSIREIIRQETLSIPEETETLSELAEFFAEQGAERIEGDGESDPVSFKYDLSRKKARPRSQPGAGPGDTGGGGIGSGQGGGSGTGGRGPGDRDGSAGSQKVFPVSVVRNIMNNARTRYVHLTPDATGKAHLKVEATGLSQGENLRLVSTDNGQIKNGRWVVDLAKGNRISASIVLQEDYTGPIEILAYRET